MGVKAFIKKTRSKLRKLKQSCSSQYEDSNSTVDDPTSPPRLRIHPSREKPIASARLKGQVDFKPRRLEAACLLPRFENRKDSKANTSCVSLAKTSRLPAGIGRHNPSLRTITETKEDAQPNVDHHSSSSATEITEAHTPTNQPIAQNIECEDPINQSLEEVSDDGQDQSSRDPDTTQVLLATSYDTVTSHQLAWREEATAVPAALPALSENHWCPVPIVSSSPTPQAPFLSRRSKIIKSESLSSPTEVMVPYQPKVVARRARAILWAVQELSEGAGVPREHGCLMDIPAVAEAFHHFLTASHARNCRRRMEPQRAWYINSSIHVQQTFLRLHHRQQNACGSSILNSSCSQTKLNGSSHSSTRPVEKEEVIKTQNAAVIENLRQELERVTTEHRAEITELKKEHNENLQICANDLQEEKSRTKSARVRAAKANKQLQARRDEYHKLAEDLAAERARSTSAHARLTEIESYNESLRQERSKLQDLLAERNDATRLLRRELDQALVEYQRLVQNELAPQRQFTKRLQSQITAANHQMRQAVNANQDLQRRVNYLDEQLERQRILNKAMSETRVARYIENPTEREDHNLIRPDQLTDLEQALLVSQDMHAKQIKDTELLATDLESKEQELNETVQQIENLRIQNKLLKSCRALTSDLRKAYENKFLQYAADNESEDSPELAAAARVVIAQEQAMTRACIDLSIDNSEKDAAISLVKRQHVKELAAKEVENARLLRQVSEIDAKAFSDEIKVINLTESLNASKENLATSVEIAATYRRQLDHRAYGEDYEVVGRMVSSQLKQANNTIASQQEDLIQQQMHIDELWNDLNQAQLDMDRISPAKGWRLRFLAGDAVVRAFRDRFVQELKLQPLVVDPRSISFPYEGEDIEAFYNFDENAWMTPKFGLDWKQRPDMKATQDEELAAGLTQLVAAVNAQAARRRAEEFQDMAGMGLLEEFEGAVPDQTSADISEVFSSEFSLEATKQETSETSWGDGIEESTDAHVSGKGTVANRRGRLCRRQKGIRLGS